MMKTVDLMERWDKRAFLFKEAKTGGKFGRKDKRNALVEKIGRYLVRDGPTITIPELVQAAVESVKSNLAARLVSGLVERFTESRWRFSWHLSVR